jgi:hypothetical protein
MSSIATDVKTAFRHRSFVACVIILAVSIAGLETTAQWFGLQFKKQPVPLKRPLSRMDKAKLAPYRFLAANTIDAEVVDALGTEEYLSWHLEDPRIADKNNSLRYAQLFVTYYTGKPDQVPHVPDMCYTGGGFTEKSATNLTFPVPALGDLGKAVPVRALTFEKPGMMGGQTPTVLYLFSVNSELKADRTGVRTVLAHPLERFGYFCKIEVRFGGNGLPDPLPEKAIEASQDLLSVVLPVLYEDHFQDWDTFTAGDHESAD